VVSWRENSYAGGDANPELRKRRRAALRLRSGQLALQVGRDELRARPTLDATEGIKLFKRKRVRGLRR
jgi:hypothetical protein